MWADSRHTDNKKAKLKSLAPPTLEFVHRSPRAHRNNVLHQNGAGDTAVHMVTGKDQHISPESGGGKKKKEGYMLMRFILLLSNPPAILICHRRSRKY